MESIVNYSVGNVRSLEPECRLPLSVEYGPEPVSGAAVTPTSTVTCFAQYVPVSKIRQTLT
mgnify:CR=1 FL=1